MNYKLIGSTLVGIVIIGILLYMCFYIASDSQTLALNIANLVLGVAVGWLVGVLISPYGAEESMQFSAYVKAVSLFVSG